MIRSIYFRNLKFKDKTGNIAFSYYYNITFNIFIYIDILIDI